MYTLVYFCYTFPIISGPSVGLLGCAVHCWPPRVAPLSRPAAEATAAVRSESCSKRNENTRKYAKPEFPIIAGFRIVLFIWLIWYIGLDL